MFKRQITALFILGIAISGCAVNQKYTNPVLWVKSDAYELVDKGWQMLNAKKYDEALNISNHCIELYSEKAKQLNSRCDVNNLEAYDGCQLLNDTAQCLYLKAQAFSKTGKENEAKETCKELEEYYFNSFVMDQCWPWKPAEVCDSMVEHMSKK